MFLKCIKNSDFLAKSHNVISNKNARSCRGRSQNDFWTPVMYSVGLNFPQPTGFALKIDIMGDFEVGSQHEPYFRFSSLRP